MTTHVQHTIHDPLYNNVSILIMKGWDVNDAKISKLYIE